MRQIHNFQKFFDPTSVRATDENGNQLGVISIREAWRLADESSLTLIGINSTASPPIVKIGDASKHRYEQAKKAKELKKKQVIVKIKECKLRPKIDDHDLKIKMAQMRRFLDDGDKVKITMNFRGRENAHPEIGHQMIMGIIEELKDCSTVEQRPLQEGRSITTTLTPIKQQTKGAANVNTETSGNRVESSNESAVANEGSLKRDPNRP